MDKQRRQQLIAKIKQQGSWDGLEPAPLVSLEDFFIGNDDVGSIGCNTGRGGPAFFEPLKAIRAKANVQDVLIEIYEVEEDDETMWPFAERIYILTNASREAVAAWLAPLEPDTVEEASYVYGMPQAAPQLAPGMKIYAAWWD